MLHSLKERESKIFMHKLSDVLSGVFKRKGIGKQVEAALMCEAFNALKGDIFPSEIADEMRALYVRGATLTIAVLNPSIVQEVKLKQADMMRALEIKCGSRIEKFHFLL